ncbi:YggT family protein [Sphingosinicella sp.]|jgi:YggT family protein|uniref:YggT family protein n=1 Tax=Sphingosinicella sp. TaxID=1917971 RepID=UPI0017F8776E|nr:YggT family protein [Sphingosinicella sp.]MBA4758508.1 YggT family protein [Sphingosinicella sp.]MEA3539989.1 YggT family protein [Pseudomonadota bacterium]|tara:strand:- start:103 stop:405 length:303 start_codon:yes stop_codon:yes gene_type:complete
MNTVAALLGIFTMVIQLVIWIIIAQVIISWLVAFNVINTSNQFVRSLLTGLDRLTEPMMRPIRRVLPDLGGIDLSPMVLILGLILIQRLVPALVFDIMAG